MHYWAINWVHAAKPATVRLVGEVYTHRLAVRIQKINIMQYEYRKISYLWRCS